MGLNRAPVKRGGSSRIHPTALRNCSRSRRRGDDSSHSDDPEVDSETTYRAQITLDRDAQNRGREVAASFHEEVKDITYEGEKANLHTVSQRSGTLRYRWIPASLHFEEIK